MTQRILIAGIGNIFLGDDAFGVEVARQLMQRPLPDEVRVVDFGIRSYDLAYAIMDGADATILVDATPRGEPPGTLYLMELDVNELKQSDAAGVDGHSMNPVRVLQMVRAFGGTPNRLYLAGCEPTALETEDGQMGLSAVVQAAVPRAVEMIELLVNDLLRGEDQCVGGSPTCAHPAASVNVVSD